MTPPRAEAETFAYHSDLVRGNMALTTESVLTGVGSIVSAGPFCTTTVLGSLSPINHETKLAPLTTATTAVVTTPT